MQFERFLMVFVMVACAIYDTTATPLRKRRDFEVNHGERSFPLNGDESSFLERLIDPAAARHRSKRTVAHLQLAWTLQIVCKTYPDSPRCSQDHDSEETIHRGRSRHHHGAHRRRRVHQHRS